MSSKHPIKAYREAHGLTQAQFAARVGTTQAVISEIEGGSRFPSGDMAFRIEDATGIPARSIVRRKQEAA
jgi:transcriptional regulator with XRE-family HTH domain